MDIGDYIGTLYVLVLRREKGKFWGYIGIMEKKIETTTLEQCIYWGYSREYGNILYGGCTHTRCRPFHRTGT